MRRTATKLFNYLKPISLEDRETRYLNESTSTYDLEYRQRQVDRGLFRKGL